LHIAQDKLRGSDVSAIHDLDNQDVHFFRYRS